MWFTENAANLIGKIAPDGTVTEYPVPTASAGLLGITGGPDGNVWFTESGAGKIGRIAPDGTITEFAVQGFLPGPYAITTGPDGNVWFTQVRPPGSIGKITPAGVITQTTVTYIPSGITTGPDGNLWFTESNACFAKIGKITPDGTLTEFDLPFPRTVCVSPGTIIQGQDGNLWFTDSYRKIGQITINGIITEYPATAPVDMVQGPDGNLWFTEVRNISDRIGSITMNGVVNEHLIPPTSSPIAYLARGPDGNLWASEPSGNRVAKITLLGCSYGLDASTFQPTLAGGTFNIAVQTGPSCPWVSGGLPDWITVSVPSGTGPANVTLTVAPNTMISRSSTFSVAGIVVTVAQGGGTVCPSSIYPGGQSFPASGGTGSITVNIPINCQFSAFNSSSWANFRIVDNSTVTYTVAPNIQNAARGTTLFVAGHFFTLEQQAAAIPRVNFVGSISHIAAEENWTTTFTLVNKSAAFSNLRLSLFGDPGSLLPLPLNFPPQSSSGPLVAASLDRGLSPNASMIIESAGPHTPPVQIGSAQLAATDKIDGFAIFHHEVTKQEAVLPLEVRNASSYVLAFDNTNSIVLGVALQNVSAQTANVPVIIRDDAGVQIGNPGTVISLAGNGHTSFVLSDPVNGFPVTANIRGTIEFDTPAGGQISVLGIRFTPPNNALTTIPPLANVGTSGGSIAHIASGGDGWQTTFVLVNVGSSAAQANLSFFADITGAPLSLPLSFPQYGSGTATVAPSVNQTLAAGATLIVQSSGAVNLLTGSAQLSTTGNVSGFVIFRHNDQEAVVALESRNANAYVLAFDNTADLATAVAINSLSTQTVNIPVTVRDGAGTQIATDMISLAANGHYAFTMVVDKYSATAGIRGTIEFGKPANGQIGVLGIRIPAIAHTFTTLPALAK